MIVSPNENTEEHKSSDKFRIEYVNGFNSCNVGNKVKIAMIADLLAFYLTGNIRIERSNASTTGILNLQGTEYGISISLPSPPMTP